MVRSVFQAGLGPVLLAAWVVGCGESTSRLELRLVSPLSVPGEADQLVVRVYTGTIAIGGESYRLGEPGRDAWPMLVPIIGVGARQHAVSLVVELQTTQDGPSETVAFATASAMFPDGGVQTVAIEIPRACIDRDGDGYGVGLGCRGPDCDDERAEVPGQLDCPAVDPNRCGDSPRPCAGSQVCYGAACRDPCEREKECAGVGQTCLRSEGVCVCRTPCDQVEGCFPFECIEGCCVR